MIYRREYLEVHCCECEWQLCLLWKHTVEEIINLMHGAIFFHEMMEKHTKTEWQYKAVSWEK